MKTRINWLSLFVLVAMIASMTACAQQAPPAAPASTTSSAPAAVQTLAPNEGVLSPDSADLAVKPAEPDADTKIADSDSTPEVPNIDKDADSGEAGAAEADSDNEQFLVPTNPNAHPELVIPGQASESNGVQPNSANANALIVYNDHPIPASAEGTHLWLVAEPSVAPNGRVIHLSGNKFDSISGDYGNTWTFVDPFTKFGDPTGLTQFCCDQVMMYDRTHNLTFWLLQWHRQVPTVSGHNAFVLAVAHGQRNTFEGTWTHYTFFPSTISSSHYADSNWWFDYPDMALSNNDLYITINPNDNPSSNPQEGLGIRIGLDQLYAGGTISFNYFISSLGFLRPTQGATNTMYFVQHIDNATERIWSWPEGSTSPTSKDVGVDGWNNVVATATCSDGTNWLGYSLNVVQAAWVANGQIGAMWNSAEGGSFPYPQVRWVRFSTTDLSVVDQGNIHSNAVAWAFPSVSVNDRGDVAGTIGFGCGGGAGSPGLAAWISDSTNYHILQPLENTVISVGTNGPGSPRWGDYYTTRRDSPYSNTWMGTGVVMRGGTDSAHAEVHLSWFGRTSDTPPANASIYANVANSTTYQDGTSAHPYSSAADGNYACSAGDNLYITAGTYHEYPITLDRPCTIHAVGGTVIIGQH